MPKTSARRRGKSTSSNASRNGAHTVPVVPAARAEATKITARRPAPPLPGIQGLLTAALVALGCWGFAFSFAFLTQDANRYLFAALAALLALMWSVSFGVRLRKWLKRRQS